TARQWILDPHGDRLDREPIAVADYIRIGDRYEQTGGGYVASETGEWIKVPGGPAGWRWQRITARYNMATYDSGGVRLGITVPGEVTAEFSLDLVESLIEEVPLPGGISAISVDPRSITYSASTVTSLRADLQAIQSAYGSHYTTGMLIGTDEITDQTEIVLDADVSIVWDGTFTVGGRTYHRVAEKVSVDGYGDWEGYDIPSIETRTLPNPWGLLNMHGNVAEWTATSWDGYTPYDLHNGVADIFVVRGGSWRHGAAYCRSAARDARRDLVATPDLVENVGARPPDRPGYDDVGFRFVIPVPPP
ncbi:MAG: formylglycine-generating enzyme family protein, partial [Planctomycetota bacterium]